MLTEDDDLIRAHDTPERMQLATSSLSLSATLTLQSPLTEADLDDASVWVITRLSSRKEHDFFSLMEPSIVSSPTWFKRSHSLSGTYLSKNSKFPTFGHTNEISYPILNPTT